MLALARYSSVEDTCKMRDLLSTAAHQATMLVVGPQQPTCRAMTGVQT